MGHLQDGTWNPALHASWSRASHTEQRPHPPSSIVKDLKQEPSRVPRGASRLLQEAGLGGGAPVPLTLWVSLREEGPVRGRVENVEGSPKNYL